MSNPQLQLLHGKRDSIIALTTKDNSLLSSSEDGYITIWDLKSSSNQEWKLPDQSIGTCTYIKDNHVHIGTDDGDILQYDLRMINEPIKTWKICDSELNVIRDGFLIGDDDGCIYSLRDDEVKVLGYHGNVCTDIAISENSETFWSAGLDSTIRTWSNENECLNMGEPGDGFVYNLSLNEEETLLCAALGTGEVGLFQINQSTQITPLSKMQGHTAASTNAQFTEWDASGQIVSCGNDQRIILWDILQEEDTSIISDENVLGLGITPTEQSFFDWRLMKMRWRHGEKINSFVTYDMDGMSAMVIVCDVSPNITIYLMDG